MIYITRARGVMFCCTRYHVAQVVSGPCIRIRIKRLYVLCSVYKLILLCLRCFTVYTACADFRTMCCERRRFFRGGLSAPRISDRARLQNRRCTSQIRRRTPLNREENSLGTVSLRRPMAYIIIITIINIRAV